MEEKDKKSMAYFWMNQKKTFKEQFEGGYMWSPKLMAGGKVYWSYEFMKDIRPGDIIFSYISGAVIARGVAYSDAYTDDKPTEFTSADQKWDQEGWRIDVTYEKVNPFVTKNYFEEIKLLLPSRYSPLNKNGDANQMYLTKLPEELGQYIDERLVTSSDRSLTRKYPTKNEIFDRLNHSIESQKLFELLQEELSTEDAYWYPSRQRKLDKAVVWYGVDLPNKKPSLLFGIRVDDMVVFHSGLMMHSTEKDKRKDFYSKLSKIFNITFDNEHRNQQELVVSAAAVLCNKQRSVFVQAVDSFIEEVLSNVKTSELSIPSYREETVKIDPPTKPSEVPKHENIFKGRKVNWDTKNRRAAVVGVRGEEWVVELERRTLKENGRTDLAAKIERVSILQGDGLGYDVLSFSLDGSEKHIEVKTTWGKDVPFEVSANELEYSCQFSEKFYLYRVFNLGNSPKYYEFKGNLKDKLHLVPTSYRCSGLRT